jgi:sulfur-carrier protein
MRVKVKLFAGLQKGRFDSGELEFPDETRIRNVLEIIGVPESEAALIFVNNTHAELDFVLKDGDTLAFFPPVGGG